MFLVSPVALCAWNSAPWFVFPPRPPQSEGGDSLLGSTSGSWLCSEFPAQTPKGDFYSLAPLTNICRNLSLLLRDWKYLFAFPMLVWLDMSPLGTTPLPCSCTSELWFKGQTKHSLCFHCPAGVAPFLLVFFRANTNKAEFGQLSPFWFSILGGQQLMINLKCHLFSFQTESLNCWDVWIHFK